MAATVYRCLTGIVPPDAEGRLMRDDCLPPSRYAKDIPKHVDEALMKGLEVRPEYRTRTMAELMYALYPESRTLPLADRMVEEVKEDEDEKELKVRLLGLDGYYKGKEIPVEGTVIMGRREDSCTVVFPVHTPGVSAVHCSIRWDEQRRVCVLRDLNSTYGTRNLGRKQLEKDKDIYLTEGEGFTIGDDNSFAVLFT
jgi:hypothetical protein